MNHEDPTDADLKARFAAMRDAETNEAPTFARTLAAARAQKAPPMESSALGWTIGTLATAAAIVLLIVPQATEKTPAPSLTGALPVLLPPSRASMTLLPSPLFATGRLPSDSILPLHLDFPL